MNTKPHKPTVLRLIEGNRSKRPLPKDEPKPELGAQPPAWLSPQAAEQWPLVAKHLDDVGVLTVMDGAALALYCEAFARWKSANDHVVKFGTVTKSPSGYPVQSPWLAIANRAHDQMVKLLVEFGMTPASRTKVSVVKTPKQAKKTGLSKYLDKDN